MVRILFYRIRAIKIDDRSKIFHLKASVVKIPSSIVFLLNDIREGLVAGAIYPIAGSAGYGWLIEKNKPAQKSRPVVTGLNFPIMLRSCNF
jgi:hypothetical protein